MAAVMEKTGSRHRMSPDVHPMRTIENLLLLVRKEETSFFSSKVKPKWCVNITPD